MQKKRPVISGKYGREGSSFLAAGEKSKAGQWNGRGEGGGKVEEIQGVGESISAQPQLSSTFYRAHNKHVSTQL